MPKAKAPSPSEIFCERLKAARLAAGLSQKSLGILAGIDEFVASTRINRYELGVHEADLATGKRLADALHVPLAYLYAESPDMADVIRMYAHLKAGDRRQIRALMEEMLSNEGNGDTVT